MVRLPAYNLVKRAFDDRENFHPSKQILLMDGQGSPWKEFLFALEEEENCKGQIKFLVSQDARKMWRAQTVPVA